MEGLFCIYMGGKGREGDWRKGSEELSSMVKYYIVGVWLWLMTNDHDELACKLLFWMLMISNEKYVLGYNSLCLASFVY